MFNSGTIKNAQYELATQVGKYNIITRELKNQFVQLQNERKSLSVEINRSWEMINSIRHIPEEFHVKMEKVKLGIENYEESLDADFTDTSAGLFSTTVGNMALVSLGPLAVFLGGLVVAATEIHVSNIRKENVSKLNRQAEGVAVLIRIYQGIIAECEEKEKITYTANSDLSLRMFLAMQQWPMEFTDFNDDQIYAAGTLVNNTLAAEKILNSKIEKLSELAVEGDN